MADGEMTLQLDPQTLDREAVSSDFNDGLAGRRLAHFDLHGGPTMTVQEAAAQFDRGLAEHRAKL